MIKLAIFDLDGTRVDSIYDICYSLNETLKKFGYPEQSLEKTLTFIGDGVERLIKRAVPEHMREDSEKVKKITEFFRNTYRKNGTRLTKPFEGISEMLEHLTDAGIKVAVASNKYQAASEIVVHHYFPDIRFSALEGRRDERPAKPDPAIIYDILQVTGLKKSEAIFIGDSDVDVRTAVNAGLTAIGVTWGYRSEEVLKKAGADIIINSPKDLLGLIKNFG